MRTNNKRLEEINDLAKQYGLDLRISPSAYGAEIVTKAGRTYYRTKTAALEAALDAIIEADRAAEK